MYPVHSLRVEVWPPSHLHLLHCCQSSFRDLAGSNHECRRLARNDGRFWISRVAGRDDLSNDYRRYLLRASAGYGKWDVSFVGERGRVFGTRRGWIFCRIAGMEMV